MPRRSRSPRAASPSPSRRESQRKSSRDTSCCPLTKSPRRRLASDAQTDAIQDHFPPGIARPALRALVAAGILQLEQLTSVSESELLAWHGMGPKAARLLIEALQARGLRLRSTNT